MSKKIEGWGVDAVLRGEVTDQGRGVAVLLRMPDGRQQPFLFDLKVSEQLQECLAVLANEARQVRVKLGHELANQGQADQVERRPGTIERFSIERGTSDHLLRISARDGQLYSFNFTDKDGYALLEKLYAYLMAEAPDHPVN